MKHFRIILVVFILLISLSVKVEATSETKNTFFMDDKISKLEETLYQNQNAELTLDRYLKALSLRARYYMKGNKNLMLASDDLRSSLFFLSKNPTSEKYKDAKERFDKTLNLMNYNPTNADSLELAKTLYMEKKYFASAYEFQQLLNKNYENATCSEYLGDIYQKINNKKQALYYYNKSLKYYDKNPNVYYKLGLLNIEMGQNDQGLENFKQAIFYSDDLDILNHIKDIYLNKVSSEPNNSNYYEILALAYQKMGNFEKSYSYFKKALQIAPWDLFVQYDFAKLLQQEKKYSEAIGLYDKILELNPYESQIRVERAKCYKSMGSYDIALREFQGALILYPDFTEAQYEIYTLFHFENLDKFSEILYPLNKNTILDSDKFYKIGEYAISQNDIKSGIVFLNYAIHKNSKNDKAYISLYKAYELFGNNHDAYATIKKAYSFLPSNEEIQKLYSDLNKNEVASQSALAISYIKNNDYKNAIKIYENINPKDPETFISLANCYKTIKQNNKAIETLKVAKNYYPKNSDLYYYLAVLYLEEKSPQTAREFLRKSIEFNKNNLKAYKLMMFIDQTEADKILDSCYDSYKKKDYKTTLNILSKGIEKNPSASTLYYYRGMVYEETKEPEKAVLDYKMVIKLAPDNLMGYYKLGKVLDKLGKEREAMEAYEKFLSEEPPKELIQEIQPRLDYLMKKYY